LRSPNNSAVVRGAIRYSAPISTPPVIMNSRPPRQTAIAPAPRPAVLPAALAAPATFPRLADYLRAVVRAAAGQGVDPRLQRAPTGLSEQGVPSDGGFLVPSEWAEGFVSSLYKTGPIAGRCDRKTTSRPLGDVELPAIDETSRADGSRFGGVLAYWSSEAASISSSYPKWRRIGFTGRKIIGIGYAPPK
jgi:HK97 family phage major capsid protein